MAFGDPAAFGNGARKGQSAIASQEPGLFGNILHIGDAPVIECDHGAPQGRDSHNLSVWRNGIYGGSKARLFILWNIECKETGCALGDRVFNCGIKAGLNRCERCKQRQSQPQGHDQSSGLRAGAVKAGKRQARQRGPRAGQCGSGTADQPTQPGQESKEAKNRAYEARGEHWIAGRDDGQCSDQPGNRDHAGDNCPCGARHCFNLIAEQAGCCHGACAGKRGQREEQGNHEPVKRPKRQWGRVKVEMWCDGQEAARKPCHHPWHQAADHQAGYDGRRRNQNNLGQVSDEDRLRRCAQYFQCGDAFSLAIKPGGDPIANAYSRHGKRGEPNEREKLAKPLDEAARAGGSIAAVAIVPARACELLG